jgi:hypothetical protein
MLICLANCRGSPSGRPSLEDPVWTDFVGRRRSSPHRGARSKRCLLGNALRVRSQYISGCLVVAFALWDLITKSDDHWSSIFLAAMGVALAMIGPGVWSLEARGARTLMRQLASTSACGCAPCQRSRLAFSAGGQCSSPEFRNHRPQPLKTATAGLAFNLSSHVQQKQATLALSCWRT